MILLIVLIFFKCGFGWSQISDPNLQQEKEVAEEAVPATVSQGVLETFLYDPKGRRDPFAPFRAEEPTSDTTSEVLGPILPLQRFSLSELKLIGIMWDISEPKALFVDPNGRYWPPVGIDDRIGNKNGYVAAIREGEVVIIESNQGREGEIVYTPRVLRVER